MSSPMQMPMLPKFAAAFAEDVPEPFELGKAVTLATPTSETLSPVEGGLTLMEFLHTLPPQVQVTCEPAMAILSPKKFLSSTPPPPPTLTAKGFGLQTAFGSSNASEHSAISDE